MSGARKSGEEQVGDRVVDSRSGRSGTILNLSPTGVQIQWNGCGHCGLQAVTYKLLRSSLSTFQVFPVGKGTFDGPRT